MHFKGQYEGEQGAKTQYLNARPPDEFIENYTLSDEMIQQMKIPRASVSRVEAVQTLLMREGKQNASFWLGLIFFEQQDHANAIDYFAKRTLGGPRPSPWAAAARYNLARTYEAEGDLAKAIELYQSDSDSPQRHGNLLRARWLDEKSPAAEPPSS
jgi:tetratricopeptide (TPR) repeat protein